MTQSSDRGASDTRRLLLRSRFEPLPLLLVLVFASLWWSLIPTLSAADHEGDSDIQSHEQDLSRIEREVEAIGAELAGDNSRREALIAELEERERDVAALAVSGRELTQMVAEQQRLARTLQQRQQEERASLAVERRHLQELLVSAHVMGRRDVLRMLLNQEDPVRATRVMSYYAYFNRARVARIDSVTARAERLAHLAVEAEREMERLERLAGQQEATRRRLDAARTKRAQVLAALEHSIHSRQDDLTILRRDAENLRKLVAHLRQRAQIRAELDVTRAGFQSRRGHMPWPLPGHRIAAAFGSRKGASGVHWDGVLLSASEGEEVRAVHDGRVIYADWLRGFGLLIVIDHGDGYMSFYGHNEALLKEIGEWVAAKEVIALSGRSGGRGEPALYFAIRRNGKPLDPSKWCG